MGAGLGCCAQKGAVDADEADARNHATPRRFFPANNKSKTSAVGFQEDNGSSDNDRDDSVSGDFHYEDEEGSDLFFSAKQSLSLFVGELPYPPTATGKLGRFSHVSVDLPESLLQTGELPSRQHLCAHKNDNDNNNDNDNAMGKIDEKKESSETNVSNSVFLKCPTEILKERLTKDLTIEAGYPGELSNDELEACLEFRRRLKEHRDPTYSVMVYLNVNVDIEGGENDNNESIKDEKDTQGTTRTASNVAGRGPEEEAFALCRFLRARQFNVDKTFAMMDERLDLFKEALTKHDLHRSKTAIEDHICCPLPVFLNQFPMLDYGIAKNGAFVVYMKAGLIHLQDGFDCINTAGTSKAFVERYMPMAWYIICRVFCETMHRLQKERGSTKDGDGDGDADGDNFVLLAETVLVVDLEGLQRELFTKRTMEFLPQALGVVQSFPEILNRVMVINVPYFFTFIWAVLKHFIDARTVRKIGFFSSLASAQKDLLELVDSSQVLAEYGGETGNPTYEEALALKQKRDGDYYRYVFERYSTKTTKMPQGTNSVTLQTFTLNETEEAELTVYTQAKLDTTDGESKSGTHFLLLPEYFLPPSANASENIINGTENGNRNIKINSNSNSNSSNTTGHPPRFGQPAASAQEHCIVIGPGSFRLVVKISNGGPIIDKALLVVSIR
jgi:hypothetical protein